MLFSILIDTACSLTMCVQLIELKCMTINISIFPGVTFVMVFYSKCNNLYIKNNNINTYEKQF